MSYCCMYKAESLEKPMINVDYRLSPTACFANFAKSQTEYDTIKVYILKNYEDFSPTYASSNQVILDENGFYTYFFNLKRAGFKFKVKDTTITVKVYPQKRGDPTFDKEVPCYEVTIRMKDHLYTSLFTLLVSLRYTYEYHYTNIPVKFNELCELKGGPHFLMRLFVAVNFNNGPGGHSLEGKFIKYMEDEEINEILASREQSVGSTKWPKVQSNPRVYLDLFQDLKSIPLEEVFTTYKQISEKHFALQKESIPSSKLEKSGKLVAQEQI